jgi:hypothetical protein
MRLEQETTPHKLEMSLLKMIVPDAALMFFLLWAASGVALFFANALELRLFILVLPFLGLLSLVLVALRFYSYWTITIRVMGSLSHLFDEFGDGKATVVADVPQPFLLFGFLTLRKTTKSPAKHYAFSLKADSQKYKVSIDCLVQRGVYDLAVRIVDWHGLSHDRSMKGNVAFLQKTLPSLSHSIRQEVLESRGVQLTPVASKPALPAPPGISPVRAKKPLSPPPALVAKLAIPTTFEQAVEKKNEAEVELEKAKTKKEQEAWREALYELQEIEKMLKED